MLNRKSLLVAAIGTTLAATALVTPAYAGDDALVGAVVGAGIGAAIGHNVHGRDGAVVGGAIGALTGASIGASAGGYYDAGYAPAPVYYGPSAYEPVYEPAPVYYAAPPVVYVGPRVDYVRGYARPHYVGFAYRGHYDHHGR